MRCPQPDAVSDIPTFLALEVMFSRLVNILLGFGGVIFFFMFISGGFKYMTAGGDPKSIASAHTTLTHAILGIILITLAFSFLVLIEYLTGADVSTFKVVQC